MSTDQQEFRAIGLTFSNETLHLLEDILSDNKFNFGGEGSMASGYEIYVSPSAVEEAIREITTNPKLDGHKVELYERVRDSKDGTRYDRLIDHLEGEDPDRPSVDGISIEL